MAADIDYVRINKKSHAKKTVGNIFLYLVLTLWAVIVLFPFYWMVVTSIKGYGAYNSEKYQVYCNVAYVGELQNVFTSVPL